MLFDELPDERKLFLIFVTEESHAFVSLFLSSSDIFTLSRSLIPTTSFYYLLNSSILSETTYETIDSKRFE
jgi:hypothetical protein